MNDIPIKGTIKYKNGDIYEGECDEKGCKKGKGLMKYKEGIIYEGEWDNNIENGNGFLCYNESDYKTFKINEKLINYPSEMRKLKFKDVYYYGGFKNNLKDGEGILYLKKNNDIFYGNIYKGNFKDNKKEGKR